MRANPIEAPFSCPLNQCPIVEDETTKLLQCRGSYDELSPTKLAEDLCPGALESAIKAEQRRPEEVDKHRRENFEAGHHFRLGSLSLDLSLVKGLEGRSAQWFRDRGFEHLHEAAISEEPSRARTLSRFLCAYQPAFTPLGRRGEVSGNVIDDINENLVQATLLTKEVYSSKEGGANDELFRAGILLLYGVQDCLVFPGTARENLDLRGTPGFEALQWAEHPLYTIEHGKKMPHRNKSRHTGSVTLHPRRMVAVNFGQMAERAAARTDPSSKLTVPEAGRLALDLLCEKASGSTLDQDHERILLHMMRQLTQKRREWLSHHKLGRLRKGHRSRHV